MTGSRAADGWLWFALVIPSSFIVHKYLGWGFTLSYAIVVAAILPLERRIYTRVQDAWLLWLGLLAFIIIVVAFTVVYPVVNTHVAGAGSDDDDAINAGTSAMLAGGFPYLARTYLGNAVHHLPGALILAAVFVLLGTSALQNLVWIPMFFLAVWRDAGRRDAVELAWVVLALSPAVLYEVVTGTGYISNTIYVVLGLRWLIRTRSRDAAAAAWGLALASRANFVFLVPLAFGYLRQHAGPRAAWRAAAVTCATIAGLTLPFYLYDPPQFSPLEGANRLLVFNAMLPYLGVSLIAAMAALALALAPRSIDHAALFRNAAIVQAFPIVAGIVLASIRSREIDLTYTRYGAFFAWFTFLALVTRGATSAESQCPRQLSHDGGSSLQVHGEPAR